MSLLSRCRASLLLVAALCACASLVAAQVPYALTLGVRSGQSVGATYRLFAGASDKLNITHSAPSSVGEGTIITLTCVTDTAAGAGFTVTPASQCLSNSVVEFVITAGDKAVGAATNSPVCTFTLSGLNVTAFDAAPALGAIAIRAPQSLTVPAFLQGATDVNNPKAVYQSETYQWTFLGNGEAPTTLSSLSANPDAGTDLKFNMTLDFPAYAANVHCTLKVTAVNNQLDEGRFGTPASLYFKVLPSTMTDLIIHATHVEFSATSNTTNYLPITPTPWLIGDEWLQITMTGCTGQGGWLSAEVTPVWSLSTVRWGVGATVNPVLAVRLPTFAYGGVHANCAVTLSGSANALLRYQLDSPVVIRAGNKVQLTAELDLVTEPLGMFNLVRGAPVALRVLLPAGVAVTLGQNLVITASCNAACTAYTGAVAPSTRVLSQLAGDWTRNSTGDMTNSPLFMFTASSLLTKLGAVECIWRTNGDDKQYYVAPANTYFTIGLKQELSISADSGLASPITSVATEGFTSSYTLNALDLGTNPTITVTVNAPQRNLNVSLSCAMAGVLNMSVSGADSSSTTSWTSGRLSFSSSGNTAGRFMISPVIDTTRLNGGVWCTWSLTGQAAFLYATPAPLSFYIGTVTELSATLLPAPFGAALVWAPNAASNDATNARINVTAKDRSALVGMGGVRLHYTCTDDLLAVASVSPSRLSFPVGEFGYGAPFNVHPNTTTTARTNNPLTNIGVTCVFKLDSFNQAAGSMDVRAYRVPDPLSFTFVPKPYIAVSGSAVQNNPVPSASSQTLAFSVSSLPASGELVSLNITCPGFVEVNGYLQWTSASASTQSTAWTMPTIVSGSGHTVQCSFVLESDNGKYRMQSADSFVWITVGALRTWSQSPATIPTVWTGQHTRLITLQPSGCLADATIVGECTSDDRATGFRSISFDEAFWATSYQLTISETTRLVKYYFTAPAPYKDSSARCTFTTTWTDAWTKVAFHEISVVDFQLGQKAALVIDGMSDGRAPGDIVTLSVRPTATVGVTGLTADVNCFYTHDTGMIEQPFSWGSVSPDRVYWFAGTSESQTIKVTMPVPASPAIFNWYCTAVVRTAASTPQQILSDADRAHFDDFLSQQSNGDRIVYQVGSPYRFALSTSGVTFLQRTCESGGTASVTVSIPGAAPANSLEVECLLTRASGTTVLLDITTPGPVTSTTGTLSFDAADCALESKSLTYTVSAGAEDGEVVCTYTSVSARASQLAPLKQRMYSGLTNPYATSESSKLSAGAIAGIVIGCIVGVALIVVILMMLTKKPAGGSRNSVKVTQAPAQQGVALVDMQPANGAAAPQMPEHTS